jgi:hypothetical protein
MGLLIYSTVEFVPRPIPPPPGIENNARAFPERFAKPFPVVEQQFSAYIPEHVKVPLDVEGVIFQPPEPPQFRRPFPITEQQFANIRPPEKIAAGWQLGGQQLDFRFVPPFPVTQQQWGAWEAQNVPLFFPPGAGKRYLPPTDYLPEPAWDERPRKPVKPIWDRGGEIEPAKPAEPAGIPALPPLSALEPPRGAPIVVRALPTFNEHVTPDLIALGEILKGAMVKARRDRDEEALALLLDALDQDEDDQS